jgi:ribose-phosphate pyrophosphokinase
MPTKAKSKIAKKEDHTIHMKGRINRHPLLMFSYGEDESFAKAVAEKLKLKLGEKAFKRFANGEVLSHQAETVRDADVFIVCQPRMGEKLMNDIFACSLFVNAVRQGAPYRITVMMPYLPFSRQDKSSNHREPILARFVPDQLKSAGADEIVVFKLHNPASISVYPSISMDNVDTNDVVLNFIRSNPKTFDLKKSQIGAPDLGSTKACKKYADQLGIGLVIINKSRDHKTVNSSSTLVVHGDLQGSDIIFIDDMADTCGTAKGAAIAAKERGARKIYFFATHPVLSGNAVENINFGKFDGVYFTDTIPLSSEQKKSIKNLKIISVAKLAAQVIDNIHNGQSVSGLWNGNGN